MTNPYSSRSGGLFPQPPKGVVIGSFDSYEAAKKAVDRLVRSEFPASRISIVGSDLKSVERVTGKMSFAKSALRGLLSGVMLGLFAGLVVMVINPLADLGTLFAVLLIAVGFSVIWSLVGYAVTPAKREFTSVMQIVANHFDVIVPPDLAHQAQHVLGVQAMQQQPAAPPQHAGTSAGSGFIAAQPLAAPAPSEPQAYGNAQQPAPPAPQEPETPPRTYAEAQAELKRQERAEAVAKRAEEAAAVEAAARRQQEPGGSTEQQPQQSQSPTSDPLGGYGGDTPQR